MGMNGNGKLPRNPTEILHTVDGDFVPGTGWLRGGTRDRLSPTAAAVVAALDTLDADQKLPATPVARRLQERAERIAANATRT